jgi:hypothetical protein
LSRSILNQSDKPGERNAVALRKPFQQRVQLGVCHQFLPAAIHASHANRNRPLVKAFA